jgi:hypothetical protein
MPCSLETGYRHLGEMYCLNFQGRRVSGIELNSLWGMRGRPELMWNIDLVGYIFLEFSFTGFHDCMNNYQLLKQDPLPRNKSSWLCIGWLAFKMSLVYRELTDQCYRWIIHCLVPNYQMGGTMKLTAQFHPVLRCVRHEVLPSTPRKPSLKGICFVTGGATRSWWCAASIGITSQLGWAKWLFSDIRNRCGSTCEDTVMFEVLGIKLRASIFTHSSPYSHWYCQDSGPLSPYIHISFFLF